MTDLNYSEPVAQLLTLGDCREMHPWPDYPVLGLGPEQISDLIRMVQDDELHWADSESLEVWAPIHAWRALGQLRAEAAVGPLLGLLWRIDEHDDDWVNEEIPEVLGMIGPAAVPGAAEYLLDPHHGLWARVAAASALAEVGRRHPEARDDCMAALVRGLEEFDLHDPALNGFLVSYLVDLQVVEAAPLMEKAYDAGRVDISILGDWEDAQIALGLLDERQTPPQKYVWLPGLSPEEAEPSPPAMPQQTWKEQRQAERRQKEKRRTRRKQQKKARRQQRKKK